MAAKQEMIHIVAKAVISLNKWITRSLIVFLKSLTEQWFTASSFLKAQLRIKTISNYKSVEFKTHVLFVCLFIQLAAKQEMIHIVAKAVISLNKWICKWITWSLIVFLKSSTEQWFTASSFPEAQLRIKSIPNYKSVEFRAHVL